MRAIVIDQNTKQELIKQFTNYLDIARLASNQLNFSAPVCKVTDKPRPQLYIDGNAYLKMLLYVRDTSTEIAWHGTVERDIENNTYTITNVFLYPQKLAAATVQTDQEKYNQWIEELDDDTFNSLRFQGHSHVNFGVTPSPTDLAYYNDILQILPKNDFYIFMIMNKSNAVTFFIYDLATNTIYETEDIDVHIISSNTVDLIQYIAASKSKYCEKPTPITNTSYPSWNYNNDLYIGTRDLPPTKPTSKPKEINFDVNDMLETIEKKYKNVKVKGSKKK